MRRFAEASGKRDLSLRRCEHSEQVSESGGARAFPLSSLRAPLLITVLWAQEINRYKRGDTALQGDRGG